MSRFRTTFGIESRICQVLRFQGIQAVKRNGVLVTHEAVIVVRHTLTKSAIYKAHEEAVRQNKLFNGVKEVWIVGQSPQIDIRKRAAFDVADALSQHGGCIVSFIDEDPYWEINRAWSEISLQGIGIWIAGAVGLALLLFACAQLWESSRAIPEPLNTTSEGI